MHRIDNPGWHMHRRMRNPMADVGCFMHGCAQDPVTRVMSTTALVLALCQVAGPSMMTQPPGFIMINAGEAPEDPIDGVMKNLIGIIRPEPRPKSEDFERNRRMMKALLIQKKQQAPNPVYDYFGLSETGECPLTSQFLSLLADNHGRGRAGWYADRRDTDYGWVTDASGHTSLRLDRAEDRHQLREDVRLRPEWLIRPTGYGAEMKEEPKKLSLAGSLPASDWDNHLAAGIVRNTLPVLFLPHTADEPLVTPGHMALEWIGIALASEAVDAKDKPVEAYHRLDLIALPWFKQRLARLRERLHHFPADYEFFVMQTAREMLPCCLRLAGILAPNGTPEAEQVNFGFDLFTQFLQGVCLGVEALGWHGYGFESPGGIEPVGRVLRVVRERGSLSKRDLRRNQQWLTAKIRDGILDGLMVEGLVAISGNEITTIPLSDYWQHILRRSFGEMPEARWQGAPRRKESAA